MCQTLKRDLEIQREEGSDTLHMAKGTLRMKGSWGMKMTLDHPGGPVKSQGPHEGVRRGRVREDVAAEAEVERSLCCKEPQAKACKHLQMLQKSEKQVLP